VLAGGLLFAGASIGVRAGCSHFIG
jgi:hypothetical protein